MRAPIAPAIACQGYTLVEMMVVAAMMSILALAVLPLAEIASTRAKERELKAALREIRAAIDAYKRDHDERLGARAREAGGGYPSTLAELAPAADVEAGASASRRYLRRVPRDPFAPEQVDAEKSWGLRSYQSPAHAPRPGADVYDVHSLSPKVGSNGIPLRDW